MGSYKKKRAKADRCTAGFTERLRLGIGWFICHHRPELTADFPDVFVFPIGENSSAGVVAFLQNVDVELVNVVPFEHLSRFVGGKLVFDQLLPIRTFNS